MDRKILTTRDPREGSQQLEMMDNDKNSINIIDSDVKVVHFRPIAFIRHDPEVWFAALESQLETRRITSQRQKYAYALESLPGDHIVAVREVVLNPKMPNVCDRLREAILRHSLPSRVEQLRRFLARHPPGDAKPRHHVTPLQSLAGHTAADTEIAEELWLKWLPAPIHLTITAHLEDASPIQVTTPRQKAASEARFIDSKARGISRSTFRRSIPHAAERLRPFTDLFCVNPRKLELNEFARIAFSEIKTALTEVTLLAHPDPSAMLSIASKTPKNKRTNP
ncbi:unnamed protein product [Schistosoma curassoni]|uniref:DUF7041 domain-containing protein n=1 Tax=Schistosoma curassoni TaxID=6186 RepID=A0A183KLH0_9TREM|nr:unnamed protein product [Schistosoma curassoni]